MVHFPEDSERLSNMSKEERRRFMRNVDLSKTPFEVKIADFGFSKKLRGKSDLIKTICGTPLYMAPQVVQKNTYSYKADIWSLGVILYELLTGLTPFHARDRREFEGKVDASLYNLSEVVKENLTLETLLFLTHCL
mmetsp:Transcript_19211/g.29442  ORF Transcript_19211/g.29442 Transcript_19211/m.29442 type:complete len:136 (-) Transcript_19211:978-1385(-)|eukprot:CAMPEP_0170484274 /NCGR_PEP_ID=MMETSP0208-20121228/3764_1 /TAXON_ID=197538 /ORGANISM="Strombidium inclinatum, Strain S3" /LENGTH=135 /DNA_ID=CAMNT_0010757563 /DNA_START=604 /DNA_END=1011 /DNA_ORIENTATION=-